MEWQLQHAAISERVAAWALSCGGQGARAGAAIGGWGWAVLAVDPAERLPSRLRCGLPPCPCAARLRVPGQGGHGARCRRLEPGHPGAAVGPAWQVGEEPGAGWGSQQAPRACCAGKGCSQGSHQRSVKHGADVPRVTVLRQGLPHLSSQELPRQTGIHAPPHPTPPPPQPAAPAAHLEPLPAGGRARCQRQTPCAAPTARHLPP